MRRAAVLPSLLTMGNYSCGFIAIVLCAWALARSPGISERSSWSANGLPEKQEVSTSLAPTEKTHLNPWLGEGADLNYLDYACLLIFVAMIFDMLDGRVARMTGSSSHFGGELDSLADACSFGAAPGIIITSQWIIHAPPQAAWYGQVMACGIAYAALAVLRLARFNVEMTPAEKGTFKGLPSPAAAGALTSMILMIRSENLDFIFNAFGSWFEISAPLLQARFLGFYALFLGLMMVSWRLKFAHATNRLFRGRQQWQVLVCGIVFFALILTRPVETLFVTFNGYLIFGLIMNLRGNKNPPPSPSNQSDNHQPVPSGTGIKM